MKILHVVNFFKPSFDYGGPANVSYEICKNLAEKGRDITVYANDQYKTKVNVQVKKEINIDGIKTYYFKDACRWLTKRILFPIAYQYPLFARKNNKNYDVIHIHEYRTFLAIVTSHYAKKYDVPYIIQGHGTVLTYFSQPLLKKIFDKLFINILLNASKVIALNEMEAEQYRKMGVKEDRIEIVANGIDIEAFRNLPEKGSFKKKFGKDAGVDLILFLGRIHKLKGVDLLVDAFAEISDDLKNTYLVLAGPDDGLVPDLKKQIIAYGISDRVIMPGGVYGQEKAAAYVDAKVFVLPTTYDTFPVTIIESWACGTPVITTNRCGICDVVSNAGIVIDYDKSQLKKALMRMLTDEEFQTRCARTGQKMVADTYRWDRVVEKIEQIYSTVLKNR